MLNCFQHLLGLPLLIQRLQLQHCLTPLPSFLCLVRFRVFLLIWWTIRRVSPNLVDTQTGGLISSSHQTGVSSLGGLPDECQSALTLHCAIQVLVAASLEPYRARRMLPCFDFPNLKANFAISIQAPQNLIALSNTAEEMSQPGIDPGTTLHRFETTPKMSTYLMGVTIGHMVSTSAISNSGKNISVWSVPALVDQHAVPLQVGTPQNKDLSILL